MRAVIQRVSHACVSVDGKTVGSIGRGYLILLGVGQGDTEEIAKCLWDKIYALRINADDNGRTNLSLADINGAVLVVSQFTLYANCKHGRRPSFTEAGEAKLARCLYEKFCSFAEVDVAQVERGVFGAHMNVELENDGPFTIVLDTAELF